MRNIINAGAAQQQSRIAAHIAGNLIKIRYRLAGRMNSWFNQRTKAVQKTLVILLAFAVSGNLLYGIFAPEKQLPGDFSAKIQTSLANRPQRSQNPIYKHKK